MSRKALDQTLDFIRQINRARQPDEICNTLLHTVEEFGFQNILAGTIPVPGASRKRQESNVLLHKWPPTWWDRYFSRGYLFVDPAIRQVLNGTAPFLWSELQPICQGDTAAARVMHEAGDFKLRQGFTVPLVTIDGNVAGFSFAGEHIELPREKRGMLQLVATFALGRALGIDEPPPRARLSRREREMLHWAAEGKTEWEIGEILNVSEHAAHEALRNVRVKLEASNRVHAVAKAIRLGLIE